MQTRAEEWKILFIGGKPMDVQFAVNELERNGLAFASRTAASEASLIQQLKRFTPDVVLCDYIMPGFSSAGPLSTVRRLIPEAPIVVLSASSFDDAAIELLDIGATDCIPKSNLRRLVPAMRRAVSSRREREALRAKITGLENNDTLTGLPNLARISAVVEGSFARARRKQGLAAVVVVNLDKFRHVDELIGRAAADELLRGISSALTERLRGFDLVSRIGPNEFLLILSAFKSLQHANLAVQRLLAAIAVPCEVAGRTIAVTATAGLALYPANGTDFDDLRCKASAAMHEAKAIAPGSLQCHSSKIVQQAYARRRLDTGLRHAIENEMLTLVYQPQFEISNGRACGVEGLARWVQETGINVPPSAFIPLAEKNGLIGPLGAWALRQGCRTAAAWAVAEATAPIISINVSPWQICEEFTGTIAQVLSSSGLPPDRLELEITESVFMTNIGMARNCLNKWKRLGVRIALDDFGTGYSSLAYLAQLPMDRLKIDRSLIRKMAAGFKNSTIVRSVICLGRELGYKVLAEGVETEEQLAMLQELGCDQAQGFLFARPGSAKEASTLMRQPWGARSGTTARRKGPPCSGADRATGGDDGFG